MSDDLDAAPGQLQQNLSQQLETADKPFVTPFKLVSVSEDALSPEGRDCNIFQQG